MGRMLAESKSPRPKSLREMAALGPSVWLATGFWVGFIPKAPGTFGSLVGLPLAWAMSFVEPWTLRAAIIVAICLLGVPICTAAARRLGNLKDPGCIVLDEIAALPITMFLVPVHGWWVYAAGFVLFRLFDISKLPPVNWFERLPNGLGIMADDWMAGVYANLALQLLVWLVAKL